MKNICKTKILKFLAFAFIAVIIIIGNSNKLLLAQADSSDFNLFSINDGPYVMQLSTSGNIAFYVCEGFFESRSFGVEDTIIFSGFCYDTNEVYSVATRKYTIEPDVIDNVPKILTVSDIHGRYDLFEDILIKSKVIN